MTVLEDCDLVVVGGNVHVCVWVCMVCTVVCTYVC